MSPAVTSTTVRPALAEERKRSPCTDVQELCHLWLLLEKAALSPLELAALPAAKSRREHPDRRPAAVVREHAQWHLAVVASADNAPLLRAAEDVLHELAPYLVRLATARPELLLDGECAQALAAADVDFVRAERALDEHVRRIEQALLLPVIRVGT